MDIINGWLLLPINVAKRITVEIMHLQCPNLKVFLENSYINVNPWAIVYSGAHKHQDVEHSTFRKKHHMEPLLHVRVTNNVM